MKLKILLIILAFIIYLLLMIHSSKFDNFDYGIIVNTPEEQKRINGEL